MQEVTNMKKINVVEALKKAEAKHNERQKEWNGTAKFHAPVKFYKTLGIFKASNVSFDPAKFEARSYKWWIFVKVIGDRVIFNSYSYSPSTSKHQSKVRSLLDTLGIKVDVSIEAPRGLQDLDSALNHYGYQIKELREAIANPKSRKAKNTERLAQIKAIEAKITEVERLQRHELLSYDRASA
jgi:hypothetical protein